ncbi:MFS transporter [Dehalococcoidia bacterium]|nr:MFS transporter [Dehalococcoidia bacterium]
MKMPRFLHTISNIKDFLKSNPVFVILLLVLIPMDFTEALSVEFFGLFMKDLGFAPLIISTIVAIIYVPSLLSLPLGILVDKFDKKKLQIISCAAAAAGIFIFAFAENPIIFALGKLLAVTGAVIFLKANFVYVASIIPKEYLGRVFGIKLSLMSFAELVGPLIAGALYRWYMRGPFITAGMLAVLSSLIAFRLPRIKNTKPEHNSTATSSEAESPQFSTMAFLKEHLRKVIGLTLIGLGGVAIHTGVLFAVIYMREAFQVDELAIGSALTFMGLIYLITPPLLGSIVDRTTKIRLWMLISSISGGTLFLFLPFIPAFGWVYLLILMTALSPLAHIAQRVLVVNMFPKNYLGRATGAIGTITAPLMIVLPFIYGFTWEIFGLRWVFTASFALMLISVITGLIMMGAKKDELRE